MGCLNGLAASVWCGVVPATDRTGRGNVVTGSIERGIVRVNDEVEIVALPSVRVARRSVPVWC